ncbi:MAG: hypothetical protein Q4B92_02830 [Ruminococcus sp.]|nr:hypothetical protein [Ruminococcus sp.]
MNTKENALARLSTGLKHERLAYKIYGIVALVLAVIIMVCGVVSAIAGAYLTADETYTSELSFNSSIDIADDGASVHIGDGRIEINDDNASVYIDGNEIEFTEDDIAILAGAGVIAFSAFYITFGIILLAVAIVNLVMASKVGKYRLNPELTAKHAGSVGSIVVAALFNEIALIFVIINFVYAKRNRAILEA